MIADDPHEPLGGVTVTAAAEGILTVENAALPLAVLRTDGAFLFANRAMRALLGYQQDEFEGRYVVEFFDIPGCPERLRHVLETGFDPETASIGRHKDGHAVPVRTSSICVKDGRGNPQMIIARASPTRA